MAICLQHPDITAALKWGYPYRPVAFTPCVRCGKEAKFHNRNGDYCYECAVWAAREYLEHVSNDDALELAGFEGID